jgi:hypothetical protein
VVLPALAIALGGSAGYIVGGDDAQPRAQAVQARPANAPIIEPIVQAPVPAAAHTDPQIEVEPDPDPTPTSHGTVRPTVIKPKQQPPHKVKSVKTTPCNVYDHMDGC